MVTDEMKKMVTKMVEAVNPKPLKIYLFGSYARDDYNKDSDYDFYIIMPDDCGKLHDIHFSIELALFENKSIPTDILVKRISDFEKEKLLPCLASVVDREGVILYNGNSEHEEIVQKILKEVKSWYL